MKTKYRIKKTTTVGGEELFEPQYKTFLFWLPFTYEYCAGPTCDYVKYKKLFHTLKGAQIFLEDYVATQRKINENKYNSRIKKTELIYLNYE